MIGIIKVLEIKSLHILNKCSSTLNAPATEALAATLEAEVSDIISDAISSASKQAIKGAQLLFKYYNNGGNVRTSYDSTIVLLMSNVRTAIAASETKGNTKSLMIQSSEWLKKTIKNGANSHDILYRNDPDNSNNYICISKNPAGTAVTMANISKATLKAYTSSTDISTLTLAFSEDITTIVSPSTFKDMSEITGAGFINTLQRDLDILLSTQSAWKIYVTTGIAKDSDTNFFNGNLLFQQHPTEDHKYIVIYGSATEEKVYKIDISKANFDALEPSSSIATLISSLTPTEISSVVDYDRFIRMVSVASTGVTQVGNNEINTGDSQEIYRKWRIRYFTNSDFKTPYVLFKEDPQDSSKFLVLFNMLDSGTETLHEVSISKSTFLAFESTLTPENVTALLNQPVKTADNYRNSDFTSVVQFKAGVEIVSSLTSNIYNSVYCH